MANSKETSVKIKPLTPKTGHSEVEPSSHSWFPDSISMENSNPDTIKTDNPEIKLTKMDSESVEKAKSTEKIPISDWGDGTYY